MIPLEYKGNAQIGKIVINRHCIVSASSIVLPDVTFHEGSSVDAFSLVNKDLEEWKLYAGIPAKFLKDRNKIQILNLEKKYRKAINEKWIYSSNGTMVRRGRTNCFR